RRAAVRRSRLRAGFPAEAWREEHRRRIGIEQNLLGIESMTMLWIARSFDAVGVHCGVSKITRRNSAMPDASGLVGLVLEVKLEGRFNRIGFRVAQQGVTRGVTGVECKVERILLRDPFDAQRPGAARGYRARIEQPGRGFHEVALFNRRKPGSRRNIFS